MHEMRLDPPDFSAGNCYKLLQNCYRPTAIDSGRARFRVKFGSGPGIRTLNLAVNRSLHPVQIWRPDLAECR